MEDVNRLQELFDAARALDGESQRRQWLNVACGDDQELRSRVEALLTADRQAGSFLQADDLVEITLRHSTCGDWVGTSIGPYKIREQLAEGGMGVVYVAEQPRPVRRKVALKIIKPGMTTKDTVARFEAERQALALMDHPNIARVFDGGATENGQPFFVMELVQGIPITDFCDQQRFATNERLVLFLQVCRAVQHAHQKGIIHRDIKPSNVLVAEIDGAAVAKVIDFGVAKAINHKLSEQTVYTQFAQMIGTPMYMSPEQVRMGVVDVDTRSDVYSLGVLLYELLTGSTPFDRETLRRADFDELRRIIREDEPRKPSTLLSTLRAQLLSTVAANRNTDPRQLCHSMSGELDWLVMKALEKDRNQRYESASALAADIDRHLNNQPIEARPPAVFYRFRKFAQRNSSRIAVSSLLAAVVLVALALAVGTHRQRSDERRQLVQDVQRSLTAARAMISSGDLSGAEQQTAELRGRLANTDQRMPQLNASVRRLMTEVEQRKEQQNQFHQFSQLARDAMDLMVGASEGDELDAATRALETYGVLKDEQWLRRLEASYLGRSQQDQVRQVSYELLLYMADSASRSGRLNDFIASQYLKYLARAETLRAPTFSLHYIRHRLHRLLKDEKSAVRAWNLAQQIDGREALDYLLLANEARSNGDPEEVIRCYEAALKVRPNHFDAIANLAIELAKQGRPAEAAQVYRACLALRPNHAPSLRNRADTLKELGELDEALEVTDRAIKLGDTMALGVRGDIHLDRGEFEQALACYDEVLQRAERRNNHEMMTKAYVHRGRVFYEMGQTEKALDELNAAVELVPKEGRGVDYFFAFSNRARLFEGKEEYSRALVDVDKALQIAANSNDVNDGNAAGAHSLRGTLLYRTKRHDEALLELQKALELASRQNQKQDEELLCAIHSTRAAALLALDRTQEAVAELNKAIDFVFKDPTRLWIWAHNELARVLSMYADSAFRDLPRALELASKAVELAPDRGGYWDTLGNVQYMTGDFAAAVQSLNKSLELDEGDDDRGDECAANALVLAMAHWQLGQQDEGRQWYDKADNWLKENTSTLGTDDELFQLRSEAEALLRTPSEASIAEERDGQRADNERTRDSPDEP